MEGKKWTKRDVLDGKRDILTAPNSQSIAAISSVGKLNVQSRGLEEDRSGQSSVQSIRFMVLWLADGYFPC